MNDAIQSSTDHRGLKLQNIIQKLSEHCDIKNPEELETAMDEEEADEPQKVPGTKRKSQDTSDIGRITVNGCSSSNANHSTTEKRMHELNSDLKLKCNSTKLELPKGNSCKVSSVLPRERISARIRSLKSKKMAYKEDWIDPDQIRLPGKKIPVQSSKNTSHDDNAKSVTPKRKRRRKQTVQSMEDYVNEAPLIQVGNLVGLRQCRLCAVMFVEKEQLINHMKAVHHLDDKISIKREATESVQNEDTAIDEKPFKCSQCESSFRKSSGLKQHVTRQHSQSTAEKTNQSQANQESSRRGTNSNDRPYACQVCGKAFKRKHHLQEHSYIHSDDKPYKCDTCSKTFNQRICLTKHLPCREHGKQLRKPSCTTTGNALVFDEDTDRLDVNVPKVSCTETRSVTKSVDSLSSHSLHTDQSKSQEVRCRVNGNNCAGKTRVRGVSNGDYSLSPQCTTNAVDSQQSMAGDSKVTFSGISPSTSVVTAVTANEQTFTFKKSIETPQEETQRNILKQQN